jgi:AraC family transcriptional regulator
MIPRIELLPKKDLVGKKITMSLLNNRTTDLWKNFMPSRKQIISMKGSELYSVEVYEPGYFDVFNPAAIFDKWAAVEVTSLMNIPEGMASLQLEGLYAVFMHFGPASEGSGTYKYIFQTWLPHSGYCIDHRPHFALMDNRYKGEDPESQEEIWIPVREKVK